MIYTVTFNPSIDYIVQVHDFKIGALNRTDEEIKQPGGKGINVSIVLSLLGHVSTATGFLGGFTGDYVENRLKARGVQTNFIRVEEDTRINIKLKSDTETEINGKGAILTESDFGHLKNILSSLQANDFLVLAGSVPESLTSNCYYDLISIANDKGVKVILDSSGAAFAKGIEARPFLIKPNHHELGELFNKRVETIDDAIPLANELLHKGVQNIIVSFASEGALFVNSDFCLHGTVPKGKVVNSVGAGDTVVAAFLAYYIDKSDVKEAFKYAITAGSATAFSDGFCTPEFIHKLLPEVKITTR